MMFSQFLPAVEQALQECRIAGRADFMQIVKDEFAEVDSNTPEYTADARQMRTLYELRARYLDWELGTGYLGFFASNPGTRYTFTRRLDVVMQMVQTRLRELSSRAIPLRILEIGCGAGLLCLEFAQQAESVIGIDVSQVALNFATRVKNHAGVTNVAFQQGDAEHLAFGDNTFDLVICSEVLEHVLQPRQALIEIERVLKPGGTAILSTPCALSLSDVTMKIVRIFLPRLESEQDIQFDKKTYLALQRHSENRSDTTPRDVNPLSASAFLRIHERFRYAHVKTMFQEAGFSVQQAAGTIMAFPPHYQVFYRLCPGWLLSGIRVMEDILNNVGAFQRFGSVTTCFQITPQ